MRVVLYKRNHHMSQYHIYVELPRNRMMHGKLWLLNASGSVEKGPYECYGKADNQIAIAHNNQKRDPTLPFGDHPLGTYKVVNIQHGKQPAHSYGPFFVLLEPKYGAALVAKAHGRVGLAFHGGDLNASGFMRPTEGCLRLKNEDITEIAALIEPGDEYVCEEQRTIPS